MGGYSDIIMAVAIISIVAIIGLLLGTGMKKQIRDSGVENYENNPKYKEGSKVKKISIIAGIVGIAIILGINFLSIGSEEEQRDKFDEWDNEYTSVSLSVLDYGKKLLKMKHEILLTNQLLNQAAVEQMERYHSELDNSKEALQKLDIPLKLSIERRSKLKKAIDYRKQEIEKLQELYKLYIKIYKLSLNANNKTIKEVEKLSKNISKLREEEENLGKKATDYLIEVRKTFDPDITTNDKKDDSKKNITKIPQSSATPPDTNNKSQQTTQSTPTGALTAKDLSLGNVSVGDSTSSLKAAKGEPNKVVTENGQIHWKYNDIDVTIVNETISTLITESSAVSTPKGIHENSPIGDVFTKYGNDYRYEVYNNIQLYEYPITSKDGAPCLLRFAVKNGENKVYYISMRKI